MGVIRVQKNSNYVVMSKVGLHDDRLSWKAKGLLAYMLSMPDNWTFYNEELMKHSPDGSSTFKAAMKELQECGYVVRRKKQDERGRFAGWETIVYEHPIENEEDHRQIENRQIENRQSENRRSENRRSENRRSEIDPLLNNKELNNELTNNELINDDDRPNPIKEFELAFGYLPPSILQQEFDHVISEGQFQEPEAIICEVIKRARENAPRNPAKYISSILKNLEYMGLFTLEAVREYNDLHDRKTKRVGRVKKSADEVNWEEL